MAFCGTRFSRSSFSFWVTDLIPCFVALLLYFATCVDSASSGLLRMVNADSQLMKWPGNEIPYYIDSNSYSVEQIKRIKLAMIRVMGDVDLCVKFIEVLPSSPRYKIKITPSSTETGITADAARFCHTYAGIKITNYRNGKLEQDVVLTFGPEGWFDSQHSLMKYFAILMGKRNEHQSQDRDGFIRVIPENVRLGMTHAYRLYTATEASKGCSYDYCSITHNQPTDFAKPGTSAFVVMNPPYYIPKIDRLSNCDCMEIKTFYGCDATSCRTNFNCSTLTTTAPLPVTNPGNAAVTVTPNTLNSGSIVCFSVPSTTSPTTVTLSSTITSTTTTAPTTTAPSSGTPCTTTVTTPTTSTTPTTTSTTVSTSSVSPPPPDPAPPSDFSNLQGRQIRTAGNGRMLRTINADPDFRMWAMNTVRFYLDPAYTTDQQSKIREAIRRVMSDLNGCIQFVEVLPTDPSFKIKVTPVDYPGLKNNGGCRSFPGVYQRLINSHTPEQRLVLTSGPNGCMDGNIGRIMKFFLIALGRRNEHQRPDRDNYIEMKNENLQPDMRTVYDKYVQGVNVTTFYPYDYCSITHNEMTDYAQPGTQAFTIKFSQLSRIPRLDRLSEFDCKIVSSVYGCPVSQCGTFPCTDATLGLMSTASGFPTATPPTSPGFGLFPTAVPTPSTFSIPTTIVPTGPTTTVCFSLPPAMSPTTLTAITTISPTTAPSSFLSSATTTCAPPVPGQATSPLSTDSTSLSTGATGLRTDSTTSPSFASTVSGVTPSSDSSQASSTSTTTTGSTTTDSSTALTAVTSPSTSSSPADATTTTASSSVSSTGASTTSTTISAAKLEEILQQLATEIAGKLSTTAGTPTTPGTTVPGATTASSATTTASVSISKLQELLQQLADDIMKKLPTTRVTPPGGSSLTSGPSSLSTSESSTPASSASTIASSSGAISESSTPTAASGVSTFAASSASSSATESSTPSLFSATASTASTLSTSSSSTSPSTSAVTTTTESTTSTSPVTTSAVPSTSTTTPTTTTSAPTTTSTASTTPATTTSTTVSTTSITPASTLSTTTTTATTASTTTTPTITPTTTASSTTTTTASTTSPSSASTTTQPMSQLQQQLQNLANQLLGKTTLQPTKPGQTTTTPKGPLGSLQNALEQLANQLGKLTKPPVTGPGGVTVPTSSRPSKAPNPAVQQMNDVLQQLAEQLKQKLSTTTMAPKTTSTSTTASTSTMTTTTKLITTATTQGTTQPMAPDYPDYPDADYTVNPSAPPPPEEW